MKVGIRDTVGLGTGLWLFGYLASLVLFYSPFSAVMGWIITAALTAVFVRQQGSPFVASTTGKDLVTLGELIEAGKVTPVIDRTYALRDAPEAFRYLDEGHARGKVVISVEHEHA